jgi:hypothetical protein
MEDLFREDQQTAPFPLALLVGMALIEIYLVLGTHGLFHPVRIILWILAGLFLLTALLLRRFTIRVNAQYLIFGFGPFRKRIRRAEITSVRIVEATLATTGIGIHRIPGGLWAWIARSGPAAEILVSGAKTPGYIVSTRRPRDLKAVLLDGDPSARSAGK